MHICPHELKLHKGGEDACAVSTSTLAVADGVGGWADSGIDPAIYSRQLCKNILKHQPITICPKELLIKAAVDNKEIGSATCVVCVLTGNTLRTANLGDSGYMLVRDGHLLYKSEEQ